MRASALLDVRAAAQCVAGWQPAGFAKEDVIGRIRPPADSQSAIQQIDNLRYAGELKTTAYSDSLIMTNGTKATLPEPERPQRRSEFVKRFVHPGLLHSQSDLERMKEQVAKGIQPWASGFERLRLHPQSQSGFKASGPFASVVRDPRRSQHINELNADSNAAYQNALMWCITGNEAHARKSADILNAWSSTLREITGNDKELGASLCGFKLANAAELLRNTYSGWQPSDIKRCEQMLRDVFYPVIKDCAPFTQQAAEKIRPEGAAWQADHPGFGTLCFTRQ